MGFKFEDDDDEITLSGSNEKPGLKKDEEKPKIPIPDAVKIPQIKPPEDKPAPEKTAPSRPTQSKTGNSEPIHNGVSTPTNYQPAMPATKNRSPKNNTNTQPEPIKAEHFFAEKEPSPVKFIRPEEAKRRKEFTKQIMIIRASVITAVAIIFVAGVSSFIPRPSFSEQPSEVNYALTETNRYQAAATAAENYSLEFVNDFMTRTVETEPERKNLMSRYLSPRAYSAVNTDLPTIENNSGKNITVYQKVTSGPYIYRIENIDTNFINRQSSEAGGYLANFVVRVQIQKYVTDADFTTTRPVLDSNGEETGEFETVTETPSFTKEWVHMSVPVVYSRTKNEITLYGYPSFVAEPKNENLDNYDFPFQNADWSREDRDTASSNVLKAQIEAFMVAWANQNPNVDPSGELASTLSQDATQRTKEGLNGKYTANPETGTIVRNFSVEAFPADYEPTGTETRKALLNVNWVSTTDVEQGTLTVYKQQYLIQFRGTDADGYKIIDIKPRYAE